MEYLCFRQRREQLKEYRKKKTQKKLQKQQVHGMRLINSKNVVFVYRRWRNLEKRRKVDGRTSHRRYVCCMKVEVLFMCVEVCYRAPSRKDL